MSVLETHFLSWNYAARKAFMLIKDSNQWNDFRGIPGIYRFFFKTNNKCYIGETCDLYKRMKNNYPVEIKRNSRRPVIQAIKKYNWQNIEIELLEWGDFVKDKDTRLALENAFIVDNESLIENKKGYNVCLFSNNRQGIKATNQIRKTMSDAQKGKNKGKDNHFFGKTHSQEVKQRLKEKATGRISCRRKPVIQLNKENSSIVKKWDSVHAAAMALNRNERSIATVCRGEEKSAYGFKWEYVTVPVDLPKQA